MKTPLLWLDPRNACLLWARLKITGSRINLDNHQRGAFGVIDDSSVREWDVVSAVYKKSWCFEALACLNNRATCRMYIQLHGVLAITFPTIQLNTFDQTSTFSWTTKKNTPSSGSLRASGRIFPANTFQIAGLSLRRQTELVSMSAKGRANGACQIGADPFSYPIPGFHKRIRIYKHRVD